MHGTKTSRWAVAASLLGALVVSSACQGPDRAGGHADVAATVLTFAQQIDGSPPEQLEIWADQVDRLSGGSLAIKFENGWRRGQVDSESGTIADVQAGNVDMAWVGARAFDRKSVTSFQALLAPMLVDSQDLQAKIFEEGIPKEMMSGLRKLDLLGVGVLPGPMRKMLGVEKPFTKPADFAGAVVGMQDSALSERSFTALGATPKMLPAGARLDGVDAYEQQLSSIWGNHYEESAGFVTSNLNLWPRPLVLLIGKTVYDDLTVNQQQALTGAADKAMLQTLHASRAEDSESANNLCREGLQFVDASARDLQSLERAWTPVYDELRANPDTNKWIDRISALKTSLNVAADAVHCGTAAPQEGSDESAGSQLEGTWTTTLTESDWVEWPAGGPTGIWTLTFQDGVVTVTEPAGDLGYRASYRAFRDRIETSGGPDDLTATFSVDGDRLTLSDIKSPGCSDCRPYVVVWGSHPWVRR